MSRAGVFAGIGAVVVLASVLAFWALRGDAPQDGGGAPRSGTAAAATDTDAPHGGASATGRAKAAVPRTRTAEADTLAVAGTVVAADGSPLGGASVECLRVPDGTLDDELAAAREALGGLVDDEDELASVAERFGRKADAPSPETVQRTIASGRRAAERLSADPAALGRIARIARDFGAGFERDAALESIATVTTDSSGAFRFDGLGKGTVELRVTAPRHQRRKTRVAIGDLGVKVELAPAGTVRGEVRSEGRPVAGADVRFRTRTVKTGPDGRFAYDGGRPPREPVIATAEGCVARGVWADVVLGAEPEPVVIDLDPAGRVTGRVTARDGSPVAGAVVEFAPDLNGMMQMFMPGAGGDAVPVAEPRAVSKDDGTYELRGVAARTVKLHASHAGFLGATSEPVRVLARGVVERVDFVLGRESVLEGRITSAAGAPVAGAEVKVDVPSEGMAKMMAQFMGGATRSGRSGDDGTYRVTGLTEGARGVTVEAPGFLHRKDTVTLPAQSSARQDFVLVPGFRIAGRVVGPDGAPVPGSTVRVKSKAAGGTANPMAAMLGVVGDLPTGVTDIAGAYVVDGLQEGPYDVTAAAPRFIEGTVTGVQPGAEDVVVTLGAAATIRGVVVAAEDGTPVAGASVRRKDKASRGPANPYMAAFMRDPAVASGTDGVFQMDGIAPGSYEIWATAKGYADSAKVKIDAVGGVTTDVISLALPPGSSLAGRVLRKSDGSPVAGAVVWVKIDSSPAFSMMAADMVGDVPAAPDDAPSATTKDDGSFAIDGLTPGKVTLEVRAAGLAPRTIAATEVPSASAVVEMSAGGALEGVVFGKDGRPSEGQRVIVMQGMTGLGFNRTATTDRAGRYRLDRIPPGGYSALLVDVDSPMGMGGMASVAIRDGETTKKDFGKRAAGAAVEGTVTADGKPVDGASVVLVGGASGMQMAQSDAQGHFRFEHVDAGDYSLMVQRDAIGGGSDSVKVVVGADGEAVKVPVELSTLAIEGTVVDAETGKGIAMAHLVLLAPGAGGGSSMQDLVARQKGQSLTDQDGHFRMTGVPKGAFSLRVTAGGYAEAEVENVTPGGTALRVAMSRGVEFAVTVLGPDEKPVAGATVVPEDASGKEGLAFDFTMSKMTGPDGVARLRMQPGRYVVHARATGFPDAVATVEAGAGSVTIRLEAGGTLEIVVKAGGAPVAGANVVLADGAGKPITEAMTMSNFLGTGGTTDTDGRARREGLRAGKVTVVVKTPAGREFRAEASIVAGKVTTVEIAAD